MKTHFNRKTVCKPLLNDIIIDEYKNDILNGKKIIILKNEPKLNPNEPKIKKNEPKMNPNEPKRGKNEPKMNPNKPKSKKEYNCKYCKKKYSTNSHLYRHIKICKEKKKDDEEKMNLLNLVEMLNEQLKEQKEEFKKELSRRDKELSRRDQELNRRNEQIDELIKKTGINIGTQNNIQNNIKILAYKNTDLSHLTDRDYLQCLNKSNMVIPNLIKRIHFDPKKPENHNIYISNIRNKYIMIYDGIKWILHNQNEAIDNLIDTNEFVIEQKLEEWIENGKDFPDIMRKFNRYLEKKEQDEVINKIKNEIKLILYNNREVVSNQIDL